MVVGGGQMGVAMAYALTPLVLSVFVKMFRAPGVKRQAMAGLILTFQTMFDPRISLLTLGAVALYGLINQNLASLKRLILPILITLGFHSIWLLSMIKAVQNVLPTTHGESNWISFLSFADFSNAISLLHPNWPENIFGKVYFLRAEFLILPILAFSSLFFTKIKSDKKRIQTNILFFASLALVGAFLAKGSNPPFGGIYPWLFENLPMMKLFRDPTKFYFLVALAYSILISYTLKKIFLKVKMFKR